MIFSIDEVDRLGMLSNAYILFKSARDVCSLKMIIIIYTHKN